MVDAFFQALFCKPPKVFGRKLRPFSLSHSLILDGLDNESLRGSSERKVDLLHAVWICGNDHATNQRELLDPPIFRMMVMSHVASAYDYEKEEKRFNQYMNDYMEVPDHWRGDSSGRPFRAPWQYHFAMSAAQQCGISIDAAWDLPVALARCYYDVWAEQQGDDSLVSRSEMQSMKAEGML